MGGVQALAFDVVRGKMVATFDPRMIEAGAIQAAVSETGLRCEPWREPRGGESGLAQRYAKPALAALSGAALLGAMIWQGLTTGDLVSSLLAHEHAGHRMEPPVVLLCLAAILAGSFFVLPKALWSLRRLQPDMNALVAVSVLGAGYLGEWIEGATLAFLFALAALLESYSLGRARKAVTALMEVTPREARVLHGDHEHRTPVEEVAVGSLVRVRPGERIPCDGEVVAGASDVNQAMITGEAAPAWKAAGDEVFAGTMNGDGMLEVRTTRQSGDTTLARIIRMVEGVQHRRAPSEQFVEKFSRYYTPAMMILALAVAVIPPVFGGGNWGDWFYQGMVILLISCPCALVISTPVSIVAALAASARQGVLIKGGAYLEEAGRLRVVAFDKTGVLTSGEPSVRALAPLNGFTEDQVLRRIAALESHSAHPLGRALLRYARERGIRPAAVSNYITLQGRGAEGEIEGERFWVGSLRLMAERGLDTTGLAGKLGVQPGSLVACGTDRQAWAVVAVEDPVRPEAPEAVRALREAGIERVIMLTGDNRAAADSVGALVGVDEVRSDLLPGDKAETVTELKRRHAKVAMVGDGVNDAQAMANATVGIAAGNAGLDVVLETADVVLMAHGLEKLPFLIGHARRTVGVIQQNVAIALALKGAFLVLAFFGVATLWMAVAADMGATLLVTFNGLRLLRVRE